MPKKKQSKRQEPPEDNVSHPRFGTKPIDSGSKVDRRTLQDTYYGYRGERIYPESAILADATRQNHSVFPRKYYVDIQKTCRDCKRPFIFFALEQKYWYETLGFYVDSDCVRCPECRKNDQHAKRHREVLSKYMNAPPTKSRALIALLEAGVYLWKSGELKNTHSLRKLRNLAHAEAKTHPVREELDSLVEALSN